MAVIGDVRPLGTELERSYEDLTREIEHLISQMTPEEVRSYFAESLFLNQVKYENDKLESYMRKLRTQEDDGDRPPVRPQPLQVVTQVLPPLRATQPLPAPRQRLLGGLGLGLAIDYSLFVVSRFREEMRRGRTPDEAVRYSVATAGRRE